MSDYKKIRKAIKIKCLFSEREAIKAFNNVNESINKILEKDKKGVTEEIKALICQLEGKLNKSSYFSIIAIAYALLISAITIGSTMAQNGDNLEQKQTILTWLFIILVVSMFIVAFIGILIKFDDYKDAFFLKALYIKLDELNNKNESSKGASTTNEAGIGENTISKKNEFEIFCDELVEGQENKVDYVRKKLKEKCQNNTNKYLMFKAEAQEDDYIQFLSILISITSMFFSGFAVLCALFLNSSDNFLDYMLRIVLGVFFILILFLFFKKDKMRSVGKWRKYILVVIDELIEESKSGKDIYKSGEISKKDETATSNKIDEISETKNYKEYVVRVYAK